MDRFYAQKLRSTKSHEGTPNLLSDLDYIDLRSSDRKEDARVIRYPLEVDEQIRLQNPWTNPDYFPYEIEEIWINRYRWLTRSHWSTPDGGCIPDFSAAEIQTIIDKKNLLVSAYRQRRPEQLWLLIVHGLKFSSWFTDSEALKQLYTTTFDRVFMLDAFGGTYVELGTT